jgi:BNR repeat-like domain
MRRDVVVVLLLLLVAGLHAPLASANGAAGARFSPQHRVGFPAGDDWEPATATDRHGHVFVLYKHYDVAGRPTCAGCDRHVLLQVSADGGRTWTDPRPVAPGPVAGGQYDPQIAVDPINGRTLWASFLQGTVSRIAVVRSDDAGRTWSAPRLVSDRPPGLDKDDLAVRGNVVAVAYDDNRNTWATVSHDDGASWSTHLIFPTDAVHHLSLAAGGAIDGSGRIFFSWDSFDAAHAGHGDGPVTLWVSRSSDGGARWTRTDVARSAAPPPCTPCGFAYLSAQMTLRTGSDGTPYVLWNGGSAPTGPERIWLSRSTDHGASWARPEQVSTAPAGVEHCFPALATGTRPGDLRVGWMDTRTGRWGVYYRTSLDGGRHLGPTTRISSPVTGYPYIDRRGFKLPYGDYFQLSVDAAGRTHAAFGEGPSYAGPGDIWVSRGL